MRFLQLTLELGAADPEPYEEALSAAGAISITLEDAGDDPVLEPAPGTTPLWPRVRLKALFEATTTPEALLAQLSTRLPAPLPPTHLETLEDRVWEREWLKDFRPMRFGRRLWICPGGQRPELPDRAGLADTDRGGTHEALIAGEPCLVELDPGLAFGTGTHPTTALCLEWLDSAALAGAQVIDYGCGSGVLAIAALKLGASAALATDIDLQALLATRDNAQRNAVADRLSVCLADECNFAPADILLANILAEPLQALAPRFAQLVRPNGRIVLSGLLAHQTATVASRYAPWFDIGSPALRDDWARLDGVRRA